MKLIESKVEYLPQPEGLKGIYQQIEKCARTCYKSEDKTTEDSAEGFVSRLVKSGHTAMLEHGTMYLAIPYGDMDTLSHYRCYAGKYNEIQLCRYSKVIMTRGTHNYVTTNFRVLQENNWLDDLKYLCSPTKYYEKRYTLKFTCSRAIANELVRHRAFSFAQESTRYCNYSKDKFGNDVTFVIPTWVDRNREPNTDAEILWLESMKRAERSYLDMINGIARKGIIVMPADKKLSPQQARDVLPLSLKTELCMTGFASDWRHLMDLRLFEKTGKVHPDMLSIMQKAKAVFEEAGVWEDIMKQPSKFEDA